MASLEEPRDGERRAENIGPSSPSSPAALDAPFLGPPEVQVHDPESPTTRRSASSRLPTAHSASASHLSVSVASATALPPSPSSPSSPSASSSASRLRTNEPDPRRSSRRRSVIDPLSGFFSNLLHLRDHSHGQAPSNSRGPTAPNSPTAASSKPAPIARPATPPPSLPPPSLAELGLSLTPVTAELSAPQFNSPNHGTFLSPNYLLLCHPQGLDVLPLTGPPACQPYALVRRVAFKSVVVMEERGVLVAIAGRRDGVRVYALEDVRKLVEWRIDVELRREHDRQRKEEARRSTLDMFEVKTRTKFKSHTLPPTPPPPPPPPVLPRSPMRVDLLPPPRLLPRTSIANLAIHSQAQARSRAVSLQRSHSLIQQTKSDWPESHHSDDEILIAAGPSGSAALDERTSASAAAAAAAAVAHTGSGLLVPTRPMPSSIRRRRPSNLDLSASRNPTAPPLPSPAPTLMTLRQALAAPPLVADADDQADDEPNTPNGEVISFAEALLESRLPDAGPLGTTRSHNVPTLITDVAAGRVAIRRLSEGSRSLQRPPAELLASIPPVPPLPPLPATAANSGGSVRGAGDRRRRWSVLDGILHPGSEQTSPTSPTMPNYARPSRSRPPSPPLPDPGGRSATPTPSHHQERSSSRTSSHGPTRLIPRLLASLNHRTSSRSEDGTVVSSGSSIHKSREPSTSSAFTRHSDVEKRTSTVINGPPSSQPPPKLEYVKLPGTKGAVAIKAVETAKKSFLAILCGDAGEKVELFAGTYRTALGLSRTFILPDSPRSLELQLQGDDLVEVFLVFAQNVFGLEPATVRVREVRIGRAERRAARRRARERTEAGEADDEPAGLTASVVISAVTPNDDQPNPLLEHQPSEMVSAGGSVPTPANAQPNHAEDTTPGSTTPTPAQADELAALAAAQMGPYTTFQQLSFAPPFPLAVLSDDCMIPPTYKEFVEYRSEHEPDESMHVRPPAEAPIPILPLGEDEEGATEGPSVQAEETPVSQQFMDVKWCYRDPKGVVQGPWKSSTMHAWFKDGYLPTDLPIRQESETEYTLLKDLIDASPDPLQPFLTASSSTNPPSHRTSATVGSGSSVSGPDILHPTPPTDSHHLLHPISLLRQPRHFGPPALFFSSRGGHSTSIVDHRGRSVLKGRLKWTSDSDMFNNHPYLSPSHYPTHRMGDVMRLEAFEVAGERAVVVALRQGGIEAMDVGDALLQPADDSRTALPYFNPPAVSVGRRPPWLWKMGMPLVPHGSSSVISLPNSVLLPTARKKSSSTPRLSTVVGGGRGSESGPGGSAFGVTQDDEFTLHDELLFLGRHENHLYCCERNSGTFRVVVLSTL